MSMKTLPGTIYHYTSADGLHGILSSGILYFTDSLFLNDRSERKNFYRILRECLKGWDSPLSRELAERYFGRQGYVLRSLGEPDPSDRTASRYFVLSCSEEQDSLPMWNYYTHSLHAAGYNLHFDTRRLIEVLNAQPVASALTGGEKILCRRIVYENERKAEEIRSMLRVFSDRWNCRENPEERENLLYALERCFEKMSLFYKERAFSHEKEIRLVIPSGNEQIQRSPQGKGAPYQFRKVRGIQVPFLALEVLDKGTVITGVTAGPALDKEMAVRGAAYMLHHYGFPKTCRVSSVPLRY